MLDVTFKVLLQYFSLFYKKYIMNLIDIVHEMELN